MKVRVNKQVAEMWLGSLAIAWFLAGMILTMVFGSQHRSFAHWYGWLVGWLAPFAIGILIWLAIAVYKAGPPIWIEFDD